MIDEKKLIEELSKNSIFEKVTVGEETVYDVIARLPKIGEWIPTCHKVPNDDYLKCYVTVTRKDASNKRLRFTTEAEWILDEWYWGNGKPMKNNWVILAWQKRKYPNPYEGE